MNFERHTTWLAYLWAFISGLFAQWTVHDYGALIGIALGIGTFWVNRHYKKKSERAQARMAAALEKRNQILEQIATRPDSAATALIAEYERRDDADKN
ncbi:alpha/beta hydrolase [Salmonella enterica]|nr:alpha/beta hydrolase [Salmonella enterica]EAX2706309.1 alpha/beta hydrolase [Salmonella enterica]EGL8404089.1 alpha/beta hydrolase [Salmonella enterica]EGL8486560.1 alpha/beta hydrolase [Salmonella enterica]EGL8496208.1 alpha/beta hydrolase [Salmonella enterica]